MAETCFICTGSIPNNETPGAYPGALSRWDNETEICSLCGSAEALAPMFSEEARNLMVQSRETGDESLWVRGVLAGRDEVSKFHEASRAAMDELDSLKAKLDKGSMRQEKHKE